MDNTTGPARLTAADQVRKSIRPLVTLATLALSSPALATAQCPPEFGPKSPIVNALGWGVIAIGLILGTLLLRYAIKQSRGSSPLKRITAMALGLVALGATAICGLALAIGLFFLQC